MLYAPLLSFLPLEPPPELLCQRASDTSTLQSMWQPVILTDAITIHLIIN